MKFIQYYNMRSMTYIMLVIDIMVDYVFYDFPKKIVTISPKTLSMG
jgi:hypothetical protein